MPVIICKNDKHLVTLCNVVFFKYERHPVTCELYLLLNKRWQQFATEIKCIGKPICLTKLIHKLLFL